MTACLERGRTEETAESREVEREVTPLLPLTTLTRSAQGESYFEIERLKPVIFMH